MSIGIRSIGIVFAGGIGVDSLKSSILKGTTPDSVETISFSGTKINVKTVNPLPLNPLFEKKLRRASKLQKMSVIAAEGALQNANMPDLNTEDVGLIFATGLGSHKASFEYKDSLITFGEKESSPTQFSHSVHNSSASYITSCLNIHGPCITISNFSNSINNALILAKTWLINNDCKYVLVGAGEELSDVLCYIYNQSDILGDQISLGEGAVFFLLEKFNNSSLGLVDFDARNHYPTRKSKYSSLFGWMITEDAFELAAKIVN